MKTYQKIKERADKIGMSISELCKRTKIHRQTLDYWKRNEPITFDYLERIEQELKKAEDERNS
jgi:transcriptional regulator with XRE-family HTH domain